MDGFATTYPAAAMNHTPDLLNHPALRPYKDSICATARPCAEITLLPAEHLTIWQSKLGGQPYWPKDMEYPRNAKGRPLHLLAQINFAETPPLPDFPEDGILQFYIACNTGIQDPWGVNRKNPVWPDGFRVIYHPAPATEMVALADDFDFMGNKIRPEPKSLPGKLLSFFRQEPKMPFKHPCAMRFDLQQKFASLNEPGLKFTGQGVPDIDDSIDPNTAIAVLREEFSETFNETLDWSGHRLGGYCNSVQEDMRGDKYRDYALLLQIDSDRENGVMWGDLGACHFFIRLHDLRRRDFSKVFYEWQCG